MDTTERAALNIYNTKAHGPGLGVHRIAAVIRRAVEHLEHYSKAEDGPLSLSATLALADLVGETTDAK